MDSGEKYAAGYYRAQRHVRSVPAVEAKQASDEADHWASPWNYTSFAEHQAGAEELLRKEHEQGWMKLYPSDAEAEKIHGRIDYSRISVVAKWKEDRQKLRPIHDLRRSGVNQRVQIKERVILPRISDLIEDVLSVIERLKEGEQWEAFALDFRDAFKHMIINENERCHLGGRALGGLFVYMVLVVGIKAGPLLGGRLASLVMRVTSVVNQKDNCRLQCYVDDPAMTTGGTLKARNKVMLKTVLLAHSGPKACDGAKVSPTRTA